MPQSAQTEVAHLPRIFLHVGAGLERYTFGKSPSKVKQDVEAMMAQAAQERTGLVDHRAQAFPEFMSTERKASIFLLNDFSSIADDLTMTFCVATFNRAVLDACLQAFMVLGLAHQVVVCLHRDEAVEGFTEHPLDDQWMLINDWPYGVLDVDLTDGDLAGMGFKVPPRNPAISEL